MRCDAAALMIDEFDECGKRDAATDGSSTDVAVGDRTDEFSALRVAQKVRVKATVAQTAAVQRIGVFENSHHVVTLVIRLHPFVGRMLRDGIPDELPFFLCQFIAVPQRIEPVKEPVYGPLSMCWICPVMYAGEVVDICPAKSQQSDPRLLQPFAQQGTGRHRAVDVADAVDRVAGILQKQAIRQLEIGRIRPDIGTGTHYGIAQPLTRRGRSKWKQVPDSIGQSFSAILHKQFKRESEDMENVQISFGFCSKVEAFALAETQKSVKNQRIDRP